MSGYCLIDEAWGIPRASRQDNNHSSTKIQNDTQNSSVKRPRHTPPKVQATISYRQPFIQKSPRKLSELFILCLMTLIVLLVLDVDLFSWIK